MRIVFSAAASHSHLFPLLPLALAARAADHDVAFATAEGFHPLLARQGLTPLAAGGEIGDAFRALFASMPDAPPDRWSLRPDQMREYAGRVFGDILPRRVVTELVPQLDGVDLVVHEAGNVGAGLAARIAGVPGVCHGFGRVADGAAQIFTGGAATALVAELGIALPDVVRPGLGDPYLDICPPSLQGLEFLATAQRVPLRPVPFAEPGVLPAGLLDGDGAGPLVYVTTGTAFGHADVLRNAVRGAAATGARVLVATGPAVDPSTLGDLPPRVRVEQWVPQAEVLPHVALVVHHGGSGTTLGCFAAGVPQLVLPQGADQFTNAEMVDTAGAGARLLPGAVTAEAVGVTAAALLSDPAVRAAAERVAAQVAAMPSPAEVVAQLPDLARSRSAA